MEKEEASPREGRERERERERERDGGKREMKIVWRILHEASQAHARYFLPRRVARMHFFLR